MSVGLIFFSYLAHRVVLFDHRFTKWGNIKERTGIAAPPEAVGLFVVLSMAQLIAELSVVVALTVPVPGAMVNPNITFWKTILPMSMVSWVLLSFFGTVYPAVVNHESLSLGQAFQAGQKTWFSVAWQLFLIPGLYGSLLTALIVFAIPPAGDGKPWDIVSFVVNALSFAAQLEIQVMVAVILTRAYRRAW